MIGPPDSVRSSCLAAGLPMVSPSVIFLVYAA
jgi:hypothetical protein